MGQLPLFANKDKKWYLLLLENAAIICYECIQFSVNHFVKLPLCNPKQS